MNTKTNRYTSRFKVQKSKWGISTGPRARWSKIVNFTVISVKSTIIFGFLGVKTQERHVNVCLGLLETWATCEGHSGVKRFKDISSFISRLILELPAEMPEYKIHKVFWRLYRYAKTGTTQKLYILSILQAHRMIVLPPVFELSTIENPRKGSLIRFWFQNSKSLLISSRVLSSRVPDMEPIIVKWYVSERSGPNGRRAWMRFVEDYHAIYSDYRVRFSLTFLFWILPIGNREEVQRVWRGLSTVKRVERKLKEIHSRLHFLSDKGGKTRVIALGDIFTQSLLLPIHDRLFDVLRKLDTDGTFDQDKQRERVRKRTESGGVLHSLDLSAATDRYPAIFIAWSLFSCRVLSFCQAVAWLLVMTNREFETPVRPVRYAVGQPMGFLSSWASFALSHHLLVQSCAHKVGFANGITEYRNYALLGDDIVIFDEPVAAAYIEALTLLGVEISMSKSVVCNKGAEFAKTLYKDGVSWKPLPLSLLFYKWDSVVSDCLSLLSWFRDSKFQITYSLFSSLYPAKELALLSSVVLSPLNTTRSVIMDAPDPYDWRGDALRWFELSEDISSLESEKTLEDLMSLPSKDPTGLALRNFETPYLQIAKDGFKTFPNFKFGNETSSSKLLVGLDFISWDPDCWPDRPTFVRRPRVTNYKELSNLRKRMRGINYKFGRLVPFYFWPSCNVKILK